MLFNLFVRNDIVLYIIVYALKKWYYSRKVENNIFIIIFVIDPSGLSIATPPAIEVNSKEDKGTSSMDCKEPISHAQGGLAYTGYIRARKQQGWNKTKKQTPE